MNPLFDIDRPRITVFDFTNKIIGNFGGDDKMSLEWEAKLLLLALLGEIATSLNKLETNSNFFRLRGISRHDLDATP